MLRSARSSPICSLLDLSIFEGGVSKFPTMIVGPSSLLKFYYFLPHKCFSLIHQIQFSVCPCFFVSFFLSFFLLFCCFIKREKDTTTLQNSLAVFYKIKHTRTHNPHRYLLQRNESKCPHEILCISGLAALFKTAKNWKQSMCLQTKE